MNNIIIFQTRPGIGDMCIFLPTIEKIFQKFPKSKITLITKKSSRAKNFLKPDFLNFDKIIYIEDIKTNSSTFFALTQFLKQKKFNKAFIMHYGLKYFLPCKISKIKNIYHYGFLKKKENISKKLKSITTKWLGISDYDTSANIKYDAKVHEGEKILIGIGSSGISRRWSNEKFIKLIKKINDKYKYEFFILAGKNEKNLSNEIIQGCPSIKIYSLCDMEIYETFRFIKKSVIYIGTDSAFMHLSGALGVLSFGLFGDTPTNYAEYSKNIIPIIPENFKKISHESNAMDKIEVEWVYENIKNKLI